MANNHERPESALKKANAFIEVGKKQSALETLHAAIQNKKWKHNWTVTIEQIMLRHLELCVELKKMHIARDGLHQYRTACQAANIASFEKVVQQFRKNAEEKVEEAKRSGEADKVEIDDLEEQESPEKIMLRAIQEGKEGTRQQTEERDVVANFQFLWATYKAIMDVLKSHSRLEEVYHETVRGAFEFCRANERPRDFKNLCVTVQKNYQDLFKQKSNAQNPVNPNHHETIEHTINTRFYQLRTAADLGLWREAYNTSSEIYELMNKVQKVKIRHRSEYYDYLAKIFWKSEDYLFHSFVSLKNVLFQKTAKKDLAATELQALASKAVMAMLCIPFQKKQDSVQATLALTVEDSYQKAKKHASLCGAQTVPTREAIIQQLTEKALIAHAAAPVKKLFELIESDFTPLSLCQDAKPSLEEIASIEHLKEYVTPVKRIIFLRLVKQLSEVYANMTIENFERAASIVPFNIGEKWMANAARQQGINIQINYREKAIVFGATRKVDMKSMRQPLIELGHKLQQAMQRVAPEEAQKKERLEKVELLKTIPQRMKEERSLNRKRKEEIEQRKEESERRREKQHREEMTKQREQEAKEEDERRKRLEDERKKREIDRLNQKKEAERIETTKNKLEQMKKQGGVANLKIGNKKVMEFNEDDLKTLDVAEINAALLTTENRQRQDKIRARKLEGKRVDHLARAFREQELNSLEDWQDRVADGDNETLDRHQEKNLKEQEEKHEQNLQEKMFFLAFQEQKDGWIDEQLESRYEDHKKRVKELSRKNEQKAIEAKITRARERKADEEKKHAREVEDKKKRQEEEERRREKEERRQEEERRAEEQRIEEERERAEEEERKKQEKEKKEAKRREMQELADRADEKRRAKEREIEERLQNGGGGDRERDEGNKRDGPSRFGGDRDRDGPSRFGGDRDRDRDEGNWRRGDGPSRFGGDRDRDRDRDDGSKRDGPSRSGGDRDRDRDEGNWRRGDGPSRFGDRDDGNKRDGPSRFGDRDDGNRRDGPVRSGGDRDRDRDRDRDDGGNWRSGDRNGGDRNGDSKWGRSNDDKWGRGNDDDRKPRTERAGPRDSDRGGDVQKESAWGRKAWNDDGGSKGQGRSDDREVRREAPAEEKKKPREPEPPVEKPSEETVDDDGFEAVSNKKKKKDKPPEPAGKAAPPPWKRDSATTSESRANNEGADGRKAPPWKNRS